MSHPLEGAFFDLTARTKIRVRGQDRHRYLNGQITNDLRKLAPARALEACVLNAKGKMNAHVFVSEDARGFFIDAEPELRPTLQERLERYIIADDVECEDVTTQLSIFHVIGAESLDLSCECRVIAINRFGIEGQDVWGSAAQHDEVFAAIAKTAPFRDREEAETLRIEQGIPRWGRELDENTLPPEANLETRAIDYDKGCYIGQEVISRMKMSGQRTKKLVGVTGNVPIHPGMRLFQIGAQNSKEIGWITSGTRSKRFGREIGLGYVKRPFPPDKFKLDAREGNDIAAANVRVEIVDLPFAGDAG